MNRDVELFVKESKALYWKKRLEKCSKKELIKLLKTWSFQPERLSPETSKEDAIV